MPNGYAVMITRRSILQVLGPAVFRLAAPAPARTAGVRITDAETTYAAGVYSLRWSVSTPAAPVDVYVSASPDAPRQAMRRIVVGARTAVAKVTDPLGGARPYFHLQPQGASEGGLWTATRVVPLEGASNFRDLGGYRTADGRRVVWGELFRSNGLSNLTRADYRTLDQLRVRVVCDLRTEQEREAQPTSWQGEPPLFLNSAKPRLDLDTKSLGGGSASDADIRRFLTSAYRRMVNDYSDEFQTLFKELLAGDVPLIVHCSAGKDRTGIGSALILTALGVPRATVVADYALSGRLLDDRQVRHEQGSAKPDPTAALLSHLTPSARRALLASDPAYIEAALDQASSEYGSLPRYLERLGIGARETRALRERYTR